MITLTDAKRELRNAEHNVAIKVRHPHIQKGCAGHTWAEFAEWFCNFRADLVRQFGTGEDVLPLIDRAGELCIFCNCALHYRDKIFNK